MAPATHGAREQRFSPQGDEALRIKVSGMQRPQPHLKRLAFDSLTEAWAARALCSLIDEHTKTGRPAPIIQCWVTAIGSPLVMIVVCSYCADRFRWSWNCYSLQTTSMLCPSGPMTKAA